MAAKSHGLQVTLAFPEAPVPKRKLIPRAIPEFSRKKEGANRQLATSFKRSPLHIAVNV